MHLEKYSQAVRAYAGDCKAPELLMAQEGDLSVYYAPFEYVNLTAKLVLVGITPGATQARNALAEARRLLVSGADLGTALQMALQVGAFSGPLRGYLVRLLDRVGVQDVLGVSRCADLFEKSAHLVHTTSVLRFPVFHSGENYSGKPCPIRTPFLRRQVLDHFVPMTGQLPNAIYVPLGDTPKRVLTWLAADDLIRRDRILSGLPHPSPANVERILYFLGAKTRESLSNKTDPRTLDDARLRFRHRLRLFAPSQWRSSDSSLDDNRRTSEARRAIVARTAGTGPPANRPVS